MERLIDFEFKNNDVPEGSELESGKKYPSIFREIEVVGNPARYEITQVNSKEVSDRYEGIARSAGKKGGTVLVVGIGNAELISKISLFENVREIIVFEKNVAIHQSLFSTDKIRIVNETYFLSREKQSFDFIFIDACKCLDTPKEDIQNMKVKFTQFLKEGGSLEAWFDGI